MDAADVLRLRLESQGLARAAFRKPEDVVSWFGAVQAQDYLGAPMRGTLHAVLDL
jgi:hypothetical protein